MGGVSASCPRRCAIAGVWVERTLASYGTEAGPAESSNLFPGDTPSRRGRHIQRAANEPSFSQAAAEKGGWQALLQRLAARRVGRAQRRVGRA